MEPRFRKLLISEMRYNQAQLISSWRFQIISQNRSESDTEFQTRSLLRPSNISLLDRLRKRPEYRLATRQILPLEEPPRIVIPLASTILSVITNLIDHIRLDRNTLPSINPASFLMASNRYRRQGIKTHH